ncbi:PadR family transcriptional regulator [candidate division KSB1 bacterium]
MYELTKHEELILISIWKLKDNAYGVSIKKDFVDTTGKQLNYGSLCKTLYKLVQKGYIYSNESTPVSQQGGRRKVMYKLTAEGKKALKHQYKIQLSAWKSISDLFIEYK